MSGKVNSQQSQWLRKGNLLAIEGAGGKVVGFHSRNLQVAHLDRSVWETLSNLASGTSADLSTDHGSDLDAQSREIMSELASWDLEVDPEVRSAAVSRHVRSFAINVAQVCNLKCSYCAAGGDGTYGDPLQHVDLETIYAQLSLLLSKVPEHESFMITFLGGEPLVAVDTVMKIASFAKLAVAGRDVELKFHMVTNGTLINSDIAEKLASIRCHVTVSIDGPKAVNDKSRPTRGGLGSTNRALKGIEELKKVKPRLGSLSAGSVFGRHHTGVLETYRFLSTIGFDGYKFDFAAEADDHDASQSYSRELCATADEAYALGGERELRKISLFDRYFLALDTRSRISNHCDAGKSHLHADARGNLTACQWFVGLESENLGRTPDAEKMARFEKPLIELNDCGKCWARFLCGGGCMHVNRVKSGSKHLKDTEFCNRTRTTIAKVIEHYAEARQTDDTWNDEGVGCEVH